MRGAVSLSGRFFGRCGLSRLPAQIEGGLQLGRREVGEPDRAIELAQRFVRPRLVRLGLAQTLEARDRVEREPLAAEIGARDERRGAARVLLDLLDLGADRGTLVGRLDAEAV